MSDISEQESRIARLTEMFENSIDIAYEHTPGTNPSEIAYSMFQALAFQALATPETGTAWRMFITAALNEVFDHKWGEGAPATEGESNES